MTLLPRDLPPNDEQQPLTPEQFARLRAGQDMAREIERLQRQNAAMHHALMELATGSRYKYGMFVVASPLGGELRVAPWEYAQAILNQIDRLERAK